MRCRTRVTAVAPDPPQLPAFRRFLKWEERKLKRSNSLRRLDEPCFKTLYGYTVRLFNVNRWFENKPWAELTRGDNASVPPHPSQERQACVRKAD